MSMADDILEGLFCQDCGVAIGPGNGYPESCKDCKKEKQENKTEENNE